MKNFNEGLKCCQKPFLFVVDKTGLFLIAFVSFALLWSVFGINNSVQVMLTFYCTYVQEGHTFPLSKRSTYKQFLNVYALCLLIGRFVGI